MIKLDMVNRKRIAIISGSPRSSKNCSGGDSKTSKIANHIITAGPDADYDLYDLCVLDDVARIQPCKGCISTANGFQCHFPCSCYSKEDEVKDYMYEKDVYERLKHTDIILVITPIHWYTVTSVVKSFFDRLVCINLTLTVDQAKELFGDEYKDSKKTTAAEYDGSHDKLLNNHYAGKVFGIFAHGDEGADDYRKRPKPPSLLVDESEKEFNQLVGLLPLAFQMRYSGLYVPSDMVEYHRFGKNIPYAKNNDTFDERSWILEQAVDFVSRGIEHSKLLPSKSKEAD
jgi:multimeric flavodoxin WrbA